MADEEEEYEEVTPEEAQAIATKFLAAAPAEEFKDVLKDVRSLGGDMVEAAIVPATRSYNHANVVAAKAEAGHKIPIVEAGAIDETHYFDPVTGKVVTVDHAALTADGERDAEGDEICSEGEDFRQAAQKALSAHVEAHLNESVAGCFAKSSGGDVEFTAVYAGQKVSARNFWGGRWASTFTGSFSPSGGSMELKGETNVLVHYYEDGNVQLTSKKPYTVSVTFSNADEFGTAVAKAIADNESKFQASLMEELRGLAEGAFKSLRRKMPITQQKFQWQNIAKYSLAANLRANSSKA